MNMIFLYLHRLISNLNVEGSADENTIGHCMYSRLTKCGWIEIQRKKSEGLVVTEFTCRGLKYFLSVL